MLAALIANSKLPFIALHSTAEVNPHFAEELAAHVFTAMGAGFAIIMLAVIYAIARQAKAKEQEKKIVFAVIALAFIIPTLYTAFAIVQYNWGSWSGGPVHWHADFEVWACGEQLEPETAKGLTTRVGSLLLHHHGDKRIHVEGVVTQPEQITLHRFFESIGGTLEKDKVSLRVEGEGLRTFMNGDTCPDGSKPVLQAFRKNWDRDGAYEPLPDFENYVLKQYTDIPPGDYIKIVFGA